MGCLVRVLVADMAAEAHNVSTHKVGMMSKIRGFSRVTGALFLIMAASFGYLYCATATLCTRNLSLDNSRDLMEVAASVHAHNFPVALVSRNRCLQLSG